jgi:GT2 family glycosyltransferase
VRRLASLPRRAWLTLRYRGPGAFLWRLLTFPLRPTPLAERLRLGPPRYPEWHEAIEWYERHGRPVTVVITTYGPASLVREAVRSVRRTTRRSRVDVIVADDGTPPSESRDLRRIRGCRVLTSEENLGFAANANRALAEVGEGDVVLMNNDVVAQRGWLEALQYTAHTSDRRVGVVGPKLLYPDGTIQSAGSHRNLGAPEWFDHRYRFQPHDFGPANVPVPVIGATGACMYLTRELLDEVGHFDESFPMAFEDADLCLRAWGAGFEVRYEPRSTLVHLESKTRGMVQGDRELRSLRRFWEKWGAFFDDREVRNPDGTLRIVYVTEGTGIGGGHRMVFEHVNRLRARGNDVELWSLEGPPDWFPLQVPVRTFASYDELEAALAGEDAVKVATWWRTALPVWRASVTRGVPAYFVQDIETSYYEDWDPLIHHAMASYRQEFRYLTTSGWNVERLREMGLHPTAVPCGIDPDTYRPTGVPRRDGVVLAVGRAHPLKRFDLTLAAYDLLPEPRPELWLYGVEPHLARDRAARYVEAPTDAEVNDLLNEATVLVQTSRHEGFGLPILEAMAAGTPVVCTDAHGNRDFCRDRVNCLMPEATPAAVAAAVQELMGDPALRERLAAEGRATAARYEWDGLVDRLVAFYSSLARAPAPDARPHAPAPQAAEGAGARRAV